MDRQLLSSPRHNSPTASSYTSGTMAKLIWFALGAGAATWWISHRPRHDDEHLHGPRGWHRGCHRPQANSDTPTSQPEVPPPNASAVSPPLAPHSPPLQHAPGPWPGYQGPWGDAKFQQAKQQASEAAAEMTESTLDNLTTTLLTWKQRLAEQRAQREREAEAQKQDQMNPPRYV